MAKRYDIRNELGLLELATLTEEQARELLERIIWDGGKPICPHCGTVGASTKLHGRVHRPGLYQCNACRGQFTITTGTVLHRTRLPLRIWIMAIFLICSSKKGTSALQVQRQLNIGSYKSAWHLCHRIRSAMDHGWNTKFGLEGGVIEADECYTGGKPRRADRRTKGVNKRGWGTTKTPVVALIDRKSGRAVAIPVKDVSKTEVGSILEKHADKSASLMTDEASIYIDAGRGFAGGHYTTKHCLDEFSRHDTDPDTGADIHVHSNTAECYFSLMKRQHIGAHHHWSKQHLHRYCTELSFRWERRRETDWDRTAAAIRGVVGKRLTYNALPTGSVWQ